MRLDLTARGEAREPNAAGLLANGHVLICGAPGLAKTGAVVGLAAKAYALCKAVAM